MLVLLRENVENLGRICYLVSNDGYANLISKKIRSR